MWCFLHLLRVSAWFSTCDATICIDHLAWEITFIDSVFDSSLGIRVFKIFDFSLIEVWRDCSNFHLQSPATQWIYHLQMHNNFYEIRILCVLSWMSMSIGVHWENWSWVFLGLFGPLYHFQAERENWKTWSTAQNVLDFMDWRRFLLLKIPGMMIIGIGLCRLGVGSFFVTKTITSQYDNYKWLPGQQLCATLTKIW